MAHECGDCNAQPSVQHYECKPAARRAPQAGTSASPGTTSDVPAAKPDWQERAEALSKVELASRRSGPHQGAESASDSLHDIEVERLDGTRERLKSWAGQVLLVVNVASMCGFADSTYTDLNTLHSMYADSGLAVLAFPSNDFNQQPGDRSDILAYAQAKQAEFETFAAISVKGPAAHPLYQRLTGSKPISWNFEAILVSHTGHQLAHWPAGTPLSSGAALRDIEGALAVASEKRTDYMAKEVKVAKMRKGQDAEATFKPWSLADPPCSIPRVTATELRALPFKAYAELLRKPVLVEGLIPDWNALRSWASPAEFEARYGHHLLKRERFITMRGSDGGLHANETS